MLHSHKRAHQRGDVLECNLTLGGDTRHLFLEGSENKVVVNTLGNYALNKIIEAIKLEGSTLRDSAGLRIRHSIGRSLEGRHKLGKKGSSIKRVIDKLRHVVNDDSRLTTCSGDTTLETTKQQGHNHGKSRGLHRLDEGDASKGMHNLRDLLRISDRLEDVRCHVLNISVSDNVTGGRHGSVSSLANLLLRVSHAGSHLRHNLWEGISELLRSVVAKTGDDIESKHAAVPVLLNLSSSKAVLKHFTNRVSANV
mmetsp:Transcript_17956/g.26474  ORF Transcript_17956/g.26474 Transcript_17956/m.26474 type:complete len:253 (+) Transcript_17956:444-1202(+)